MPALSGREALRAAKIVFLAACAIGAWIALMKVAG